MPKYATIDPDLGVKQLSKRRIMSATPSRSRERLNESRALSPSASARGSEMALSIQVRRRLGGPGSPVRNFMMKASRE